MMLAEPNYLYKPGKKERRELFFIKAGWTFVVLIMSITTVVLFFLASKYTPGWLLIDGFLVFITAGLIFIAASQKHRFLYTIFDNGFIYPERFRNLRRADNNVSFEEVTAIAFSDGGLKSSIKLNTGQKIEVSFVYGGASDPLDTPPYDGTVPYLILIQCLVQKVHFQNPPNFEWLKQNYREPWNAGRSYWQAMQYVVDEMKKINPRFADYPADW